MMGSQLKGCKADPKAGNKKISFITEERQQCVGCFWSTFEGAIYATTLNSSLNDILKKNYIKFKI